MKKLKKIIVLAFNPPYLPMIQSGSKKYEFRDKVGKDWEEGTEVYLAITKNMGGSGKIEAKFTIGKVYRTRPQGVLTKKSKNVYVRQVDLYDNLISEDDYFSFIPDKTVWLSDLQLIGYNGQQYAVEIKDFQMLPEALELEDVYSYNKVEEEMLEYAKEYVVAYYSHKTQKEKKKLIAEALEEIRGNFENNEEYYEACFINKMPQSWCYGGVLVDV